MRSPCRRSRRCPAPSDAATLKPIAAPPFARASLWRSAAKSRTAAPAQADTATRQVRAQVDKADPGADLGQSAPRPDAVWAGASGEKPADILDRLIDAVPPAPDGPAATKPRTPRSARPNSAASRTPAPLPLCRGRPPAEPCSPRPARHAAHRRPRRFRCRPRPHPVGAATPCGRRSGAASRLVERSLGFRTPRRYPSPGSPIWYADALRGAADREGRQRDHP